MTEKVEGVFWETSDQLLENGFHIKFITMSSNSPLHWHKSMEILFILNGRATVNMDGKKHCLNPWDMIVVDSTQIHDGIFALPQTMGVCIHISKNFMRRYLADIELLKFQCNPQTLLPEQRESYNHLCSYMKELTILYFNQNQNYQLKSSALVLELLADLVEHFSSPVSETLSVSGYNRLAQMEQICRFVEEHHQEKLSLQDGADQLNLNKDYFCRFFKENMGVSFIQYVNQVRINHIYQDLIYTEDGIQDIMERHGFYNQKLFYRMFKETYDCTPARLRQIAQNSPYR